MPRGQASIQAFGRISKAHGQPLATKKRKASPEISESPELLLSDDLKQGRKKLCVKPQRITVDSATRALGRSLAGLELARRSPVPSAKRAARSTASPILFEDTPPTSPCTSNDTDASNALPVELEELIMLNSSMLAALTLHYAHNGTAAPLDIRQLVPSVTKIWGKRTVTEADVKRCLGVLERSGSSPFKLFDYGLRKVCIEMEERGSGRAGAQFDQDRLSSTFDRELRQAWNLRWRDDETQLPTAFIESLSHAQVHLSPNASKSTQSTALKRGQKRLEEVLGPRDDDGSNTPSKRRRMHTQEDVQVQVLAQAASPQPQTGPAAPKAAPPQARAQSLFDRICAKQSQAALLPAPATKDQLIRTAALQRVEEVMSMLDLLVAAKGQGPRASFPLASLVQSIRGSLRSPMATDEVERCLTVMEKEVAIGYVKCLRMGSVSGVVVDTGRKPRKDALAASLKAAGM